MSEQVQEIYVRPDYSWNQLPFQANGAAIAIYITALTTLVSGGSLHGGLFYLAPVIGYLIGLVCAYLTHWLHVSLLLDLDQRKRLNAGRQLVLQNINNPGLPFAEKQQLEATWQALSEEYNALLTPDKIKRYMKQATNAYALSMLLFLLSTIAVTIEFGFFLAA
jgi:hypothetical protein